MDKAKVLDLAKLARIELRDEEVESLTREFDVILGYVGEVNGINKEARSEKEEGRRSEEFPVRNIMREDTGAHESGIYTKDILMQAPAKEGDYLKVKKFSDA